MGKRTLAEMLAEIPPDAPHVVGDASDLVSCGCCGVPPKHNPMWSALSGRVLVIGLPEEDEP